MWCVSADSEKYCLHASTDAKKSCGNDAAAIVLLTLMMIRMISKKEEIKEGRKKQRKKTPKPIKLGLL